MAHYLDKDGLLRFFQGLKNVFAAKNHSHTTVNGHTVNADVPSGAKFTDTDTIPSAYCTTTSSVQAKTATCTNFHLNSNSTLYFVNTSSNSYAGKITMNVNGTGAKDVWINGAVSSSSNYSLPAGGYLAFYDGTKWLFRTDGKLTGSITGDAATVNGKTVGVNVPADAKFTDTVYTHPSYTSKSSGLYKVTVDSTGHVSAATAVAKSDITGLGIPAQDTTYSAASQSAAGLMSAADKKKLDGIAAGAQVNAVTGVKGNSESSYRTGNVNLTAVNIGAAAATHSHAASDISSGTLDAARLPAMTGATASAAGTQGAVPAPAAGNQSRFLRGDGTWATPSNNKVNVTLATTTKAYLLGTSTTPTTTAKGVTALADTGVYLDTTEGKLTATSFAGNGASLTSLNGSNISSGTVAAARIADLDASKIASGTFSRDRLPGGLWIDMGTISSLPVTKTFTGVRTDMVVARMELGTPSAQRSDWTVNTDTADSITVSGTISGSTTCKILLVQAESGTAS